MSFLWTAARLMIFAGGAMMAVSVLALFVAIFSKDAKKECKDVSKQAFWCALLLLFLSWLIG